MADTAAQEGGSSAPSRSSVSDDHPTMLLPPPSFGIPASRPYTSATMASALTYVDLDAEVPRAPSQGSQRHNDSQVSIRSGHTQQQELPVGPALEAVPQTPQTSLTFLLVSGRRRTMNFEPDTTVGRVKELVWNAWPSEWQDERPPAPSYLRILYLGKILQDDDTLAKLTFPSHTPPPSHRPLPQSQSEATSTPSLQPPSTPPTTIVHLSIRPYAPPSDDDALKKKGRKNMILRMGGNGGGGVGAEGGGEVEASGCCAGCVIC